MHHIENLLPAGGVSGETNEPDDIARRQAEPNPTAPVQLHWTIQRRDHPSRDGVGMTYGGLQETRMDAEVALDALQDDVRTMLREAYHSLIAGEEGSEGQILELQESLEDWKNNAGIIYLEQGEKFFPWGTAHVHYLHGVNDGTHGGRIPRTPNERRLLLGEE